MATTDTVTTSLPPVAEEGFWDGVQRSYVPSGELRIASGLKLCAPKPVDVDPVTYEVIRYSLANANLEHSALLQRLCVSPITMLARDYQTSILTARGDLVFLGPNLQYFSNSHSLSVKFILEHRSEDPGIHPGDVFLSNDPFVGAPHQPDTALLAPVFVGDELFCWVANTLHYSDVGGSVPGSFCIDAADTFMEPVSWPPVKLAAGGHVRTDVEAVFARQSRLPVALKMDLRAALAGIETARRKIEQLVERYGVDALEVVIDGTLDAGEALFAERLREIPDGRWSHRVFTEAAVPGDRRTYAYQINVTKAGDRLIVDNVGTEPQAGAINVTFAAFSGAVLAAITQTMTSDLGGAYGGVYRRVEFRPESGRLNCAEFPAAVSPSGAFTTELQLNAAAIIVAKMLACGDDASRELILGPSIPHFYGTIAGGADSAGNVFVLPDSDGMMGSLGATPGRDGVDVGGHFWIPDGIASNVEDAEAQYPVVVLYRRMLRAGADGAGRHRGGRGFVKAVMPRGALAFQLLIYLNEAFTKAQGLAGGNPGSRASFRLIRGSDVLEQLQAGTVPRDMHALAGEETPATFKGPVIEAADGDVWEWVSPSTAGYGDPLRRDPERVLEDVGNHVLDAETAARVYGVVVGDGRATGELRRERRRERLGGREPAEPAAPPPGARRVSDLLFVADSRWWCGGADLGAADENYKDSCVVNEVRLRDVAPEFDAADHDMADRFVFREYVCPATGYRIDTELARAGEPFLHDIALFDA
ncbi:MAG TPA: hydantoinase B/oxoprolinase family protein [Solirubrobacteraceae bacterium]